MSRIPFLLGLVVLILTFNTTAKADLLVNGNFESGNTGFTTDYPLDGSGLAEPGYSIVSTPPQPYSDWDQFGDHTSGTGLMLVANGGSPASARIWSESPTVTTNTDYDFSFWAATVNTTSFSLSDLHAVINGSDLGHIVLPEHSPISGGAWVQLLVHWNSGASTSATLSILNSNTNGPYNDFAIDDVHFDTPSAVPEPGSMALLALGAICATAYRVRRQRKPAA